MTYSSLLIIRHESHFDIYIKGAQIGVWKDRQFIRHVVVNAKDGSRTPVEIDPVILNDALLILTAIA